MKLEQIQPEHLERIERLYHAALERDANEREAFLAEACAGDESLRGEVLSLLDCDARAEDFIEAPALEVAAQLQTGEQESLLIGRRLGPYQILDLIGAGGMGEVYRAMDSRLGREVAVKVLPPHLAQDPGALARFNREVRAVAALSHPNILSLYDFGAEEDICFAVMELLDGETLRSRIAQDPLSWREAVEIGVAATEGLSAAHAKGIIHRDLKPENIFLTSDGRVKILDFGLARVKPMISAPADSLARTTPGIVIGTVGYMSPEQVRGEEADAPSDIFSFGCMLYETMSGQRPFARPTPQETMAAILKDDPPKLPAKLPKQEGASEKIPLELERIIARCLEKQPTARYQSAQDLAGDLKAVLNGSKISTRLSARSLPRWRRAVWVTAVLTSLIVGVALYLWVRLEMRLGMGLGMERGREQEMQRGQSAPNEIDSVAVLPFANASNDPQMEYLPDGITESLINSLSQLPALTVMARSTVFTYRGREADPRQVGEALKVRAVVTGRVERRGEHLLIHAELVDASNGARLWGEQYQRSLADLPAVQDDITREISAALRLRMSGDQQRQIAKRQSADSDAYQLYLRGRHLYYQESRENQEKALDYFNQAVALDPRYALAYAGIAHVYAAFSAQYLPPGEAMPKARQAALTAIKLDETLPEAHFSLSLVKLWGDWDWAGAESELKRAIELNPNFVNGRVAYANLLLHRGRFEEAAREVRLAKELDPLSVPLSAAEGRVFYYERRYDQAIAHHRKSLELYPDNSGLHRALGLIFSQLGGIKRP